MKKILLLTITLIGFMGNTNAGTVTIVRGDEIAKSRLSVVLLPDLSPEQDAMNLTGGEKEKVFHNVKAGTYTSIGYDYIGVMEPINCDNLNINVTNNSNHIIRLDGDLQKKTMTCTVKED